MARRPVLVSPAGVHEEYRPSRRRLSKIRHPLLPDHQIIAEVEAAFRELATAAEQAPVANLAPYGHVYRSYGDYLRNCCDLCDYNDMLESMLDQAVNQAPASMF